jgi:hypothetical protein
LATTGFVLAGTGSNVDRGGTSNVWSNPGNITTDNAVTANATVPTDYLVCSNFNFASVPDGATIVGVTVRVQSHETGTSDSNYIPQLISATTPTLIGAPKSAVTVNGTTPTNRDAGGVSDLWGAALTPETVKSAGFGVALWSTDATNVLLVDVVWIAIEYLLVKRQILLLGVG